MGSTVKRLAARASLQRPYEDQIQTPRQLFEWANQNISNIDFTYVNHEEYIQTEEQLAHQYSKTVAIPGTQKLHAFVPTKCRTKVTVKSFSSAPTSTIFPVATYAKRLGFSDISGYVVAVYGGKWYLSYVLAKNEDVNKIKVTFLYPQGPSPSFSYPTRSDILWIPSSNVVCKVNPITPTGRTYSLQGNEVRKVEEIVQEFMASQK